MQAKIFVFCYSYSSYDGGKILVLSKEQDILELPNYDMIAKDDQINVIEDAVQLLINNIGIKTKTHPRLLDIVYSCLDSSKQLYIYYMTYVPLKFIMDHEKNYYLIDIDSFRHNSMIRKFICSI